VEEVFNEPPKGLPDEHSKALKEQRDFVRLEVIGPERSDVAALPYLVAQWNKRKEKQKEVHRGWVLNRHFHRSITTGKPESDCPLLELLWTGGASIKELLDHRVLHVSYERNLLVMEQEETQKLRFDALGPESRGEPFVTRIWLAQRLGLALEKRWLWLDNKFALATVEPEKLTWLSFLAGLIVETP